MHLQIKCFIVTSGKFRLVQFKLLEFNLGKTGIAQKSIGLKVSTSVLNLSLFMVLETISCKPDVV